MTGIENEKLPTVEQVEQIIRDWGRYSIDEFAQMFSLTREVVEATVAYIRELKRVNDAQAIPVMACYRNDSLESIVRCAGSKHGYL
ncbi:hypothetical protein D3OALGA1CA_1043 [Olavius algarvensis associated proteobacterium Delta 3]|nr:hypothetical protein D3OALGA1CA_1043 [Olavius algarvensis associated proteobacterium Delta 3]CAB5131015.1 hypothetical protein D3OALGB2SA_3633 [Olavius algarvensis associated proteobacterium Delta 3]